MSLERITQIVSQFRETIERFEPGPRKAPDELEPRVAKNLLESMLLARHLDVAAHELRKQGAGHYTICSSGHESNVVLGYLTTPEDPALVHYRSAALVLERARQRPFVDAVQDILLGLVASSNDPLCSGRHKAFGSKNLGIIPQTSTIASQVPRAVGLAFGLELCQRLGQTGSTDSIVVVSFGDASVNHSTLLGGLNAASWTAHQNLSVPLLAVCEDNGLGISVRTPPGWIEQRLSHLPHFRYFAARGDDLSATLESARQAVAYCRNRRRPAVLHLQCVRLLGHAGSDVDNTYRTPQELTKALLLDPLLCAAKDLIACQLLSKAEVLALDRAAEARVTRAAAEARVGPKLSSRADVMAPITWPNIDNLEPERPRRSTPPSSARTWSGEKPGEHAFIGEIEPRDQQTRRTLAQGLNFSLRELLKNDPNVLIFGEDVARKGGVYGVTKGLLGAFGPNRVFNTLLDEQTIFGLGLGTANLGLLPIIEIQYLAYLHNAIDQLRGEALTLPFFSNGAYDNPLIVRIASFAYQKGFGGHFHNDNAIAALREIPGLIVASPARADDAYELLNAAAILARRHRRVIALLEPIALYHTRDLFEPSDEAWTAPLSNSVAAWSEPRIYGAFDMTPGETARESTNQTSTPDLVIATYANGLHLSLRAARRLEREHGLRAKVLDLRWLMPLPVSAVLRELGKCQRLLVVDECRESGGIAESLICALLRGRPELRWTLLTGESSFIPLGEAANLVLIQEDDILNTAAQLCGNQKGSG